VASALSAAACASNAGPAAFFAPVIPPIRAASAAGSRQIVEAIIGAGWRWRRRATRCTRRTRARYLGRLDALGGRWIDGRLIPIGHARLLGAIGQRARIHDGCG